LLWLSAFDTDSRTDRRTEKGCLKKFKNKNSMNVLRPFGRARLLTSASVLALTLAGAQVAFADVINGGFEDPSFTGIMSFFPSIPGWSTTEPVFELWNSGFLGVPAYEGKEFAELNAYTYGTLTQTVPAVGAGEYLGFHFAHRGREGEEIMRFTVTDLGANGIIGGGDDTVLLSKEYTDGLSWGYHDGSTETPLVSLGNPVQISFASIFTVGGDGKGNLLDDVAFGPNVPDSGSTLTFVLIGAGALALFARGRIARSA
jgi:hypothetical protein